jgi:hypothetical protein
VNGPAEHRAATWPGHFPHTCRGDALRGRRQNSANIPTGAKLERRNFNLGSLSYQLAKGPASIFTWFCGTTPYNRRP